MDINCKSIYFSKRKNKVPIVDSYLWDTFSLFKDGTASSNEKDRHESNAMHFIVPDEGALLRHHMTWFCLVNGAPETHPTYIT